jgi:hypothetical protein
MAKNECWSKGGGCEITLNEADAAYYGAALDSGEPAEWTEFTGVALIDFAANANGVMTRCIGFTLTVTGQDDAGNQAVTVGDPLYFHDTTGVIDKAVNGGQFIGWATVAVNSGASTDICVLLDQDPDYTRFMDEQLLEFGDGAAGKGGAGDVQFWFETDDNDFYSNNNLEGSRWYMNSGGSTGRIDMQNHAYTHTAGEQTGVRISPRLTVTGAPGPAIQALNVVPSIDDDIAAAYLIGINADVYMRGNNGTVTTVIRGVQSGISDENIAGRIARTTRMLLAPRRLTQLCSECRMTRVSWATLRML